MTQTQRILSALKRGAKLTQLDILRRFDCLRASARIADIRRMGYKVRTEYVRTNTGKVVARYSMEG